MQLFMTYATDTDRQWSSLRWEFQAEINSVITTRNVDRAPGVSGKGLYGFEQFILQTRYTLQASAVLVDKVSGPMHGPPTITFHR
jgi:hypothetical protein